MISLFIISCNIKFFGREIFLTNFLYRGLSFNSCGISILLPLGHPWPSKRRFTFFYWNFKHFIGKWVWEISWSRKKSWQLFDAKLIWSNVPKFQILLKVRNSLKLECQINKTLNLRYKPIKNKKKFIMK